MDELAKVVRVVSRDGPLDEVLLVLDGSTGSNGLAQARAFTEAVGVTGAVITKLDGTAKGGIAIAVERDLGIPIKLIGVGERPEDLLHFEPAAFVDELLGAE
jgi:fused signal recognition particle receptor